MIQALIVRELLRRIVAQHAVSPQQADKAMQTVDTALATVLAKRVEEAKRKAAAKR